MNSPTAAAEVTKTHEAQPVGTYQPTALDAAKARADFRISSVGRKTTDLVARAGLAPVIGRGIKQPLPHRPDFYVMTDAAIETLRTAGFTFAPDW